MLLATSIAAEGEILPRSKMPFSRPAICPFVSRDLPQRPSSVLSRKLLADVFIELAQKTFFARTQVLLRGILRFGRRGALQLAGDVRQDAIDLALTLLILVIAGVDEEKLAGAEGNIDRLQAIDKIFVGIYRVAERNSECGRLAGGRPYQHVVDRERARLAVGGPGSAAPPLHVKLVAGTVKIDRGGRELDAAFQEGLREGTMAGGQFQFGGLRMQRRDAH